jgi:parallel beta-helix repeat protein
MRLFRLVLLSFILWVAIMGVPLTLAQSDNQSANQAQDSQQSRAITRTVYIPIIHAPNLLILCENKVYHGFTKSPFILETAKHKDPNIQKIIRNCTFKNAAVPGIIIDDAQNVLIEGNRFENIRSKVAGQDVHGINVRCQTNCNIVNIKILSNSFTAIGADGIQLGTMGLNIKDVAIENNIFEGSEAIGENGIDIKGVEGPIYVRRNTLRGFRPCQANQDCTGSNGEAMIVHTGRSSGKPKNIIIRNNKFINNNFGLVINNASEVSVRNNQITNNLQIGLYIVNGRTITVAGNTFQGNSTNSEISGCINCSIKLD